jgi:tRNA-splicing ligase RtcB
MEAKSFIVRGLVPLMLARRRPGDVTQRGEAALQPATAGGECRKDAAVIDETPMAYKDIHAVMAAQADHVHQGVSAIHRSAVAFEAGKRTR